LTSLPALSTAEPNPKLATSKLRVTDVATNRSVVFSITDRSPFIRGRVLDLSLAGARKLGIRYRGVVKIRAEVL